SCAAAMCFCAAHLASPSAMPSTIDSVLVRLAPLQPPAACAGATAKATAAIAAAPSSFLIMLFSILLLQQTRRHCGNLQNDHFRCSESGGMNFARERRDQACAAEPHANGGASITAS